LRAFINLLLERRVHYILDEVRCEPIPLVVIILGYNIDKLGL